MAHLRALHRGFAAVLMISLPLAVLVGPRVRLPFIDAGDFRVQDFLMAGAILYFLVLDLTQPRAQGHPLRVRAIFWILVVGAALSLFYAVSDSGSIFQTFYTMRLFQVPIIALIVFRCLETLKWPGVKLLIISVTVSTMINLAWIGFQALTNNPAPLWDVNREYIFQYGPGLLGDGAPFPSGQVLVILLAGLVSTELYPPTRKTRIVALRALLVLVILGAIISTESRISLGSGALIVVLWFVLWVSRITRISAPLAGMVGLLVALIAGLGIPSLPRVGLSGIESGVSERLSKFYLPVIQSLEQDFFFGLGPGAWRSANNAEYHSLYFGVFSDFGFLGLIIVLSIIFLLLRWGLREVSRSSVPMARVFAFWSVLILLNLLVSGALQDSYISATPNHLAAIVFGMCFWLSRRGHLFPDQFSPRPSRSLLAASRARFLAAGRAKADH